MSWTSISHAHEYWKSCQRRAEPPPNLEDAETFILTTRPATAQDAACILDVIYANGGDPRCDGLDHAALGRIRGFLAAA